MATRVKLGQQRPNVDLAAHRPEPGHDGAGGGGQSASTCAARSAPTAGSQPARAASARSRSARLAVGEIVYSMSERGECGAAMAVGVSSSQGLREQVGTGYRDQDHDRASSLEDAYWPWG